MSFRKLFPRAPFAHLNPIDYDPDGQNFFSDADVFDDLITIVKPETIIEVGTWKGHSANHMANTARDLGMAPHIICVDTWLGSREHYAEHLDKLHIEDGRPTLWERFIGNTLRAGNADMIYPLPLPSSTAALVLADQHVSADLIYIDGSHEYADVRADLAAYMPLLRPGGIMFGDDFHHDPVRRAVIGFAAEAGMAVRARGIKWILGAP